MCTKWILDLRKGNLTIKWDHKQSIFALLWPGSTDLRVGDLCAKTNAFQICKNADALQWICHLKQATKLTQSNVFYVLQKCRLRHVFPMSLGCLFIWFQVVAVLRTVTKTCYFIRHPFSFIYFYYFFFVAYSNFTTTKASVFSDTLILFICYLLYKKSLQSTVD